MPIEGFLDREAERTQLTHDLLSGQKVFLVAPRRYGKSSLIAVVLDEMRARKVRTVSLTVTQHATYGAFLESFAEACLQSADLGAKLRDLARSLFVSVPQITYESGPAGEQGLRLSFEPSRSVKDDHRLAREVFALPGVLADRTADPWVVALDEFQKITDFDGPTVEDALRAAVQTQRRVGYIFPVPNHRSWSRCCDPAGRSPGRAPCWLWGRFPSLSLSPPWLSASAEAGWPFPRAWRATSSNAPRTCPTTCSGWPTSCGTMPSGRRSTASSPR